MGSQSAGTVILVEDLTETKLLEAELAHSERLTSIGRLAAGVAHEIGNPVTGIACLAQNIEAESNDGQVRLSVRQILDQTKRISNILRSLVSFSHSGVHNDDDLGVFNLCDCVEEAIGLVKLGDAEKYMECTNHCDRNVEIFGDRQRLLQVFVNVFSNACDASGGRGKVNIDTQIDRENVAVMIQDQGVGMTEAELSKVFEPFFTTKEPGKGTGLGLALAYNIIQDHGGQISIESEAQVGTTVTIRLPQHGTVMRSEHRVAAS
jgi:signal transduction histidine kinase